MTTIYFNKAQAVKILNAIIKKGLVTKAEIDAEDKPVLEVSKGV